MGIVVAQFLDDFGDGLMARILGGSAVVYNNRTEITGASDLAWAGGFFLCLIIGFIVLFSYPTARGHGTARLTMLWMLLHILRQAFAQAILLPFDSGSQLAKAYATVDAPAGLDVVIAAGGGVGLLLIVLSAAAAFLAFTPHHRLITTGRKRFNFALWIALVPAAVVGVPCHPVLHARRRERGDPFAAVDGCGLPIHGGCSAGDDDGARARRATGHALALGPGRHPVRDPPLRDLRAPRRSVDRPHPVGVMARSAFVITVSDGVSSGTREDKSGEALEALLSDVGFEVRRVVVPDEIPAIITAISESAREASLIVTTGGTGFGPRDVTPEATIQVLEREAPGLAHMMMARGLASTAMAGLSRARAGSIGSSLVVNLPGSSKGAVESLEAILEVIPHALDLLSGDTEHR